LGTKVSSARSEIEWGVASRPAPGQTLSGDTHVVQIRDRHVLLAVVDGLGLGNEAAIAANTAVSIMKRYAADKVESLVNRCHRSLMMSRGAVMTLVSIDIDTRSLTWLGVGNVEAALLRADPAVLPSVERLQLHGGLVGYQMPILKASKLTIERNDLLVLTTDGIGGDVTEGISREEPVQKIADSIIERHYKSNDDALALVARYLGKVHE
jgi:serine/threonine protein phosphatase PrpC